MVASGRWLFLHISDGGAGLVKHAGFPMGKVSNEVAKRAVGASVELTAGWIVTEVGRQPVDHHGHHANGSSRYGLA